MLKKCLKFFVYIKKYVTFVLVNNKCRWYPMKNCDLCLITSTASSLAVFFLCTFNPAYSAQPHS